VSQEVRANGLHVALGSTGESTDDLEILLTSPALRQGREGDVDNLRGSHYGMVGDDTKLCVESVWSRDDFFAWLFFCPESPMS
jgi:hypothetical protein